MRAKAARPRAARAGRGGLPGRGWGGKNMDNDGPDSQTVKLSSLFASRSQTSDVRGRDLPIRFRGIRV